LSANRRHSVERLIFVGSLHCIFSTRYGAELSRFILPAGNQADREYLTNLKFCFTSSLPHITASHVAFIDAVLAAFRAHIDGVKRTPTPAAYMHPYEPKFFNAFDETAVFSSKRHKNSEAGNGGVTYLLAREGLM
jgi:hypothetical protein